MPVKLHTKSFYMKRGFFLLEWIFDAQIARKYDIWNVLNNIDDREKKSGEGREMYQQKTKLDSSGY